MRIALAAFGAVLLVACADEPEGAGGDTAADVPSEVLDADTSEAVDASDARDSETEWTFNGPTGLTLVEGPPNFATAAAGWFRGDLHYHSTYSEDAADQGGDDLATCIAIADAYRDPTYLAAFPEGEGDALDFIAVTDHRTDAALSDPLFTHEHLALIGAEEFGSSGHANIWGLQQHIPHDPQAGETPNERRQDAIAEAHAQGAVFSVNHPCQDNLWVWDLEGFDAIEVWNGTWTAGFGGTDEATLDEEVAGAGVENPYIRDAVRLEGSANDKALRFWQNHLTAGVHVAVVGGGDRHMVLPAALPTTYVKAADRDSIVEGIAAGSTFVSRSPHGPQIVLEATGPDGTVYPMGSELPGPGFYAVRARVSRATGGELRIITGPVLEPDADGRYAAQPEIYASAEIGGPHVEGLFLWEVPEGGGWLHAVVLEPLVMEPLTPVAESVEMVMRDLPKGKDLGALLEAMVLMVDTEVLLDPASCDPATWQPNEAWCMPVDDSTLATFYLPDMFVRLLSRKFEGGEPTEWTMGAVTSAFLAR